MFLGRLDVAARSFDNDLPHFVTQAYFFNADNVVVDPAR